MSEHREMLPEGLLVSWYGDDLTGSAAVMEVLSSAGLPAVLFLTTPTAEMLRRFAGYRGVGIAGVARSKSPLWMETHLPPVFDALARMQAPITHYKVCSTLDSAPTVGSIGKAIDLALARLQSKWVPILVAAPALQRYQLFGNLFAVADGIGWRLDQHPTMSRHPVTPMNEADVRVHLLRQTAEPIGLVDFLALTEGRADGALESELSSGRRIVAIDVLHEASLIEAGRLIWEHRRPGLFAVGSQGVQYALVAYWRSVGMIASDAVAPRARAVDRIVIASGSCSPVTAQQIEWAEAHGFRPIRLDVRSALDERAWRSALANAARAAVEAVDAGYDPLVFSARGPEDPAIADLWRVVAVADADLTAVNETIGRGLGSILDAVLKETGLRRGVLAGGDTSSHGAAVMGVEAVELLGAVAPGASLFRAHSHDSRYADAPLELAFKGGQMGPRDYFGQVKQGCPSG